MIGVVDYGVGNIGSIINMYKKIQVDIQACSAPEELDVCDKIILPGVGAFDEGVSLLKKTGFFDYIKSRSSEENIPVLGICLGMQLLGHRSEEGHLEGLGLIDAHTIKLSLDKTDLFRIPHMGWREINPQQPSLILTHLPEQARFYFVHSYHMICQQPSNILAIANYGFDFVCMVQHKNVFGVQFHPEKSHKFGLALLKGFAEIKID